ncbi:TPA: hypothetical protein DEO28_01445 [Candidatus Dependentiae bacterium]|nr:MAG: hypothetical protein UR14_C0003G0137 [candidate division TM6 bacterium GW2011_GWE2_31_21]KKP53699.1 MAG: hypothetical protein UR43_C0003G0020 [candidate division TM6 bacterium GW2011_GWF2_33_332]HBS48549.1 hypothetical protein [Candidatus Dependentiae bacterium]HBZ73164.1 hypothetical protein [Candidatus Dependentiae bacterium]
MFFNNFKKIIKSFILLAILNVYCLNAHLAGIVKIEPLDENRFLVYFQFSSENPFKFIPGLYVGICDPRYPNNSLVYFYLPQGNPYRVPYGWYITSVSRPVTLSHISGFPRYSGLALYPYFTLSSELVDFLNKELALSKLVKDHKKRACDILQEEMGIFRGEHEGRAQNILLDEESFAFSVATAKQEDLWKRQEIEQQAQFILQQEAQLKEEAKLKAREALDKDTVRYRQICNKAEKKLTEDDVNFLLGYSQNPLLSLISLKERQEACEKAKRCCAKLQAKKAAVKKEEKTVNPSQDSSSYDEAGSSKLLQSSFVDSPKVGLQGLAADKSLSEKEIKTAKDVKLVTLKSQIRECLANLDCLFNEYYKFYYGYSYREVLDLRNLELREGSVREKFFSKISIPKEQRDGYQKAKVSGKEAFDAFLMKYKNTPFMESFNILKYFDFAIELQLQDCLEISKLLSDFLSSDIKDIEQVNNLLEAIACFTCGYAYFLDEVVLQEQINVVKDSFILCKLFFKGDHKEFLMYVQNLGIKAKNLHDLLIKYASLFGFDVKDVILKDLKIVIPDKGFSKTYLNRFDGVELFSFKIS